MLPIFQRTPIPLETPTPQLSLNQVTDIPTLPPVTVTPTLSLGESVNYLAPGDIFTQVTAEVLPEKAFQPVTLFGSVKTFTVQTDVWARSCRPAVLRLPTIPVRNSKSIVMISVSR